MVTVKTGVCIVGAIVGGGVLGVLLALVFGVAASSPDALEEE
jgi:hypothetical protein